MIFLQPASSNRLSVIISSSGRPSYTASSLEPNSKTVVSFVRKLQLQFAKLEVFLAISEYLCIIYSLLFTFDEYSGFTFNLRISFDSGLANVPPSCVVAYIEPQVRCLSHNLLEGTSQSHALFNLSGVLE